LGAIFDENQKDCIKLSFLTISDNFMEIFPNIYNDKNEILENFSNSNFEDVNIERDPSSEALSKLGYIQENYLNLCRFYVELKKSILELNYRVYKKINKDNPENSNFPYKDIINRNLNNFIMFEEKKDSVTKNIEKEKYNLGNLKNNLQISKEKNARQKKYLRLLLSNKNPNLFFCFQCGNILKKTNMTESNCRFDSNCKNYSIYYCYYCKINSCKTCVVDIKNGKCTNGHLMFKYEGQFEKKCYKCEGKLNLECYGCNLCDIFICCKCFKSNADMNVNKCSNCKFELLWKKKFYSFCKKCLNFKQCFYKCFFCKFHYCVSCISPENGLCGGLHQLERFYLEDYKNFSESFKLKAYLGNFIENSCSKCENLSTIDMKICKRCNYVICENCETC
jgi:hypothetical protein